MGTEIRICLQVLVKPIFQKILSTVLELLNTDGQLDTAKPIGTPVLPVRKAPKTSRLVCQKFAQNIRV